MKKTLYILRHAKATGGAEDKVRPLAERGVHEAETMGKHLAAQTIRLDQVFCSSSVRTRETWQHVHKYYKQNPIVDYTDRLYLASANEMVNFLAALPEKISNVMLIGHNPGLHELCVKLIQSGNERLRQDLDAAFPPCSLASIEFFELKWKDITLGGTLADIKFMEVA